MAIAYASPRDAPAARCWGEALAISCFGPERRCDTDLCLVMDGGVLSLRDQRERRLRDLSVDFNAPEPASKKQLLGRAVGRRTRSIVDATAGWGEDARRLHAMGYRLTLVERNPLMAALLSNAAARAGASMEVVAADAIDYLQVRPGAWDCVYLDPMFPPKRRTSTLAKRPMRLLRELTGDDPDKDRLIQAAMIAAAKRVVVKRPDHGEPVLGEPAQTVAGKLVCYDVYFT